MLDHDSPGIAPSSIDHRLYEQIVEACRTVFDPDIHMNIYDMGLIYTIAMGARDDERRGAAGIWVFLTATPEV